MPTKHSAGRGRLSSIEQLPEPCSPHIVWASEELRRRERTQTEIYEEFYQRLEAVRAEYRGELEFTIPSFSSFNRHSLRLAALARRMDDTREIAGSLAKSFDAEASDDLTVIAAEAIKTLIFEILTDAGESGVDPKGTMQLASALRSASQAQGVSTSRRHKIEEEFEEKVNEVVDKAGAQVGLSADQVAQIRRDVLGVRT